MTPVGNSTWTVGFVADVVTEVLEQVNRFSQNEMAATLARRHGISLVTVKEWVDRARFPLPPLLPPDVAFCRFCERLMIPVELPHQDVVYRCGSSCRRRPIPASSLAVTVTSAVVTRVSYSSLRSTWSRDSALVSRAVQRVSVGGTVNDLLITWRQGRPGRAGSVPPAAVAAHARQLAESGRSRAAIKELQHLLAGLDPLGGSPPPSVEIAASALLYAKLRSRCGQSSSALPWAVWSQSFLRDALGRASKEAREALSVVASLYLATNDFERAASSYSDLVCHHAESEGAKSFATLRAQATLALVLYRSGRCDSAQRLLDHTISVHRQTQLKSSSRRAMEHELQRMRLECGLLGHNHVE